MDLEATLTGRPVAISRPPVTARVVRSDESGVWAVPVGGDTRHPIGPCKGSPGVVGGAVGAVVIVTFTDTGPWIAQSDESGVDSVNGRVGAVVLGASDVGAATPAEVAAASTADRNRANHTGSQPASTVTGLAAVAVTGSASDLITGTVAIARIPTGQTSSTVPLGNDTRFSDARPPTGTAAGALTGTYPGPTLAAGAVDSAAVNATIKDAAAGTASLRTLGTGALQAAAGTHVTDTANPHAVTKTQVGLGTVPNVDATARVNHSGTQAASTVTGIAAAVLLTSLSYDTADKSTISATLEDFAAANLAVTFTAPASGKVLVRLTGVLANTTAAENRWGLRDGAATVTESLVESAASNGRAVSAVFKVTGLTTGTAYTYKWAARTTAGTLSLLTTAATGGPAVMEVWSA